MSTIEKEYKSITTMKGIQTLLAAQVTTVATTITLASGEGLLFVAISSAYMTANCATATNAIITLTTGIASTSSVIIPLCRKGDTLESGSLLASVYIDSSGNCSADDFSIACSNTLGSYIKLGNGKIHQWNAESFTDQACNTTAGTLFHGSRTVSFPVPFGTTESIIVNVGQFRYSTGISWGTQHGSPTVNDFVARIIDVQTRATGTSTTLRWDAIGRWR